MKTKRGKEGEMWVVAIQDDVDLTKMLVVKAHEKCVELQEVIEGTAKGPKKIVKYLDIEFVEKLT